ncbi:MAG: YqgE/AlgH family protein [Gammaproteobacteria bacterium]|nr:YqgE/AlgH family protein [Gammaproteobacteria bacterium]
MAEERYCNNQFLVAMPNLGDANFDHSVTLLFEYTAGGATGLVINRPTDLKLADMLRHMELERSALSGDPIVYWGGPLARERGFVVHRQPGGWESSLELDTDLFLTSSRDVLAAIGRGQGPQDYLVVLGYAGWGEGQLDEEILANAWLTTPVSREVLFRLPPPQRWLAATRLIGVDPASLASVAGHA